MGNGVVSTAFVSSLSHSGRRVLDRPWACKARCLKSDLALHILHPCCGCNDLDPPRCLPDGRLTSSLNALTRSKRGYQSSWIHIPSLCKVAWSGQQVRRDPGRGTFEDCWMTGKGGEGMRSDEWRPDRSCRLMASRPIVGGGGVGRREPA